MKLTSLLTLVSTNSCAFLSLTLFAPYLSLFVCFLLLCVNTEVRMGNRMMRNVVRTEEQNEEAD